MKKNTASVALPLILENVEFPETNTTYLVKVIVAENRCSISMKSSKEWNGVFSDLSKNCDNENVQLPQEIIFQEMTLALSSLASKTHVENEHCKSVCNLKENDTIVIFSLTIPVGSSFNHYSFELQVVDEIDSLKVHCRKLVDKVERLENEAINLKTELSSRTDALLFRDARALKSFGYCATQLKKAGFSEVELLLAWSKEELEALGVVTLQTVELQFWSGDSGREEWDLSNENRTVKSKNGSCVTVTEPFQRDKVSNFKIKIDKMDRSVGFGITNDLNVNFVSILSCSGWFGSDVCKGIATLSDKWEGFHELDEIFFKHDPNMEILSMKLKRLGVHRSFVVHHRNLDEVYFFAHLTSDSQVTLEEMTRDEKKMYFNL